MTSLWPRLEPLLAKVQKPARYIGCEDGAVAPEHGPGQGGLAARLPRHLRDRPAQPGPADPLRDPERARRRRRRALLRALGRPRGAAARARPAAVLASTPTAPAADFDVLAFNLSAELVYTNVLNCIDLAGVPVRAADRGPEHPLVVAGGHCTFNPEPLADFVDVFVHRRRRGGRRRDHRGRAGRGRRRGRTAGQPRARAADAGRGARRLRAVDVRRRPTTAPALVGRHAAVPGRARPRSTSARSPTWPSGRTRSASSCRSPRWCTTASTSRCSGAAPGAAGSARPGMITRPVRERPGRAGAHDGPRRPAAHRLRRGEPHVAVDRRLLAASSGSWPTPSTTRPAAARSA